MKKGGIIISKVEMTKLWHNDAFVPVTIAKLVPQQTIVKVKTVETDGYNALVLGVVSSKKEGEFSYLTEFRLADDSISSYVDKVGQTIELSTIMEGITALSVTATSKGKGFQGAIKRHGLTGNFATHGHKFTRVVGSMGNRKPRRTMKGHPAAGHMGLKTVTIKNIAIVSQFVKDGSYYICLKGSVPGWRNNYIKAFF